MNANNPERVDKTERVGKISGLESGHQLENGGRPRAENVIVRGALRSILLDCFIIRLHNPPA